MALTNDQKRAIALARAKQRQAQLQQPAPDSTAPLGPALDPSVQSVVGAFGDERGKIADFVAMQKRLDDAKALGVPESEAFRIAVSGTPEENAAAARAVFGGIPETLAAMGSGLAASSAGGLGGLTALARGEGLDAAVDVIKETQKSSTFAPRTEAGKENLDLVGRGAKFAMTPLTKSAEFAGDVTLDVTGSPAAATAVKVGLESLPDLIGLKGIRTIASKPTELQTSVKSLIERSRPSETIDNIDAIIASDLAPQVKAQQIKQAAHTPETGPVTLEGEFQRVPATKNPIVKEIQDLTQSVKDPAELVERVQHLAAEQKGGANKTAQFMLDGVDKVVKDPKAIETLKQGFTEGIIASVKGSTKTDRRNMGKALDLLKKGKANERFASAFRPSDVVGDSVFKRYESVAAINKKAGEGIDKAARDFKGRVNLVDPVDSFIRDLKEMGISVTSRDGVLTPNFKGSDIEDLEGPSRGAVKTMLRRSVDAAKSGDPLKAHRMKKLIDTRVTFGRGGDQALDAKLEVVFKKLRSGIDGTLDRKFPKYDSANKVYSESIGAIDNFRAAVGSKFDPKAPGANRFLGTTTRRLMSNAQTRTPLNNAINQLGAVSGKHGKKFEDDVLTQAIFVDELQRMFGANSTTSFLGDIEKGVKTGLEAATGRRGPIDLVLDAGEAVIKTVKGVNEDNAIKAMSELLKESR